VVTIRDWARDPIPEAQLDEHARYLSELLAGGGRQPAKTLESPQIAVQVLERLCKEFEQIGWDHIPVSILRETLERIKRG